MKFVKMEFNLSKCESIRRIETRRNEIQFIQMEFIKTNK